MVTDIPQETVDAIVDALSEDDKEGAILLYYRASDEDLDHAWTAVQGILIDLGEDAKELPNKATDDPAYRVIKYYLTADAATRRKDYLRASLVALTLLAVAVYLLVLNTPRLVTSLRSFFWPSTEATVVEARVYSEGYRTHAGTVSSRNYMDFIFQYEVDGEEYIDGRVQVQYYDLFGDKPFKPDDIFTITYNPDDPTVTVYDRQIYSRMLGITVGLICFAGGGFIAAVGWSGVHNRRRLKRLDNNKAVLPKSV